MIGRLLGAIWQFHLNRTRRRWSKFEPPAFTVNRLAFRHVEFGYEEFVVDTALFNVYESYAGVWELVIKVEAGDVTRPSELQEVATGSPSFEATALLPADETVFTVGQVVLQPEGYDRLRGVNLSNIFYLTHKNVEELRLEVLSVLPEALEAQVTGACVVNGSLLTHPDARFSVQAKFVRAPDLRRGVK